MKSKHFIPQDDKGKALWLINFKSKLKGYATVLGISPDTLNQLGIDSELFDSLIESVNALKDARKAFVQFKDNARDGSEQLGSLPTVSVIDSLPIGALGDIFGRVRKLAQNIKLNAAYTEAMGDDLGIIGTESHDDPSTWKPELHAEFSAGTPVLKWTKGNSEALKLWADRGDGKGFHFIAISTQASYADHCALPPVGQSAVWKYQAVYLLKDEEVGQFSAVLDVTVTGHV